MAPTFIGEAIARKPKGHKCKFTEFEDQTILSMVNQNESSTNWEQISSKLGNRTPRQCKDRYNMYLAPGLNKTQWTTEEDNLLLVLVSKLGKKWKTIAQSFNRRPEINLKNRYKLLQRRLKAFQYQPTYTPQMFQAPVVTPCFETCKQELPTLSPIVEDTCKKQESSDMISKLEGLELPDFFSFDENAYIDVDFI